ncbi:F-actin-monooxygenase Mical isoform X3 [Uranotaenia lowii]|uniref:F-actin-monooxygenase Mical isoform X3 n=1 Tax=Uranotaenia lowii TaxID=190385 RepID=UPI0024796FAF|nr:F-actin-monooxygenase Mical isoform X3 [Uranotaenia lowii]
MNPAISDHNAASLAAEMFDHFCAATTMRQILGLYRNMCDILGLRPGPLNEFYPKFKAKVRNWKAQALWKKFDARASHRVYNKGTAANGTRVLVIGAGPCGLRTAIEAQLLGAKVVVVEKRDRISRNNVLHLWPFLITDLKALGAKKFYGKFCAGSIDHISIRQLQCILLKVALLLGVEVHEGVSFVRELEPKDGCGWRAAVSPEEHAVSHYEFDVLIGADGKRNTLEGFKRKEFRGKLAIAITANFINKKTEAEAKVEEISGVAFIFNQSFFKQLYQTTGIDLENIVYYKDETHYFVMTAKKHSLLDKGVIIQDYADPAELLSSGNVDTTKLLDYAREAANFSTKYQLPNLEFAVNHYGKPDVAMFDFTSMFAADNSCKVTVRKNYRLLSCLVGDSLLEPFWPTGSGCARGFLSSMDAAYAIKLFSNAKNSALAVLAQRESIYRLLAQTTPENLHRDIGAYTLDPSTRYPNLNKSSVNVIQIKHLLDTDDPSLLEQTFIDTNSLTTALGPEDTLVPKRKRRSANDTVPLGTVLLRWVKSQLKGNELAQDLQDPAQCFTSGRILCTLIARYRPDLVNLEELDGCGPEECNEYAFDIFENHLGIPRVMTGPESTSLAGVDPKQWLNYLEQICEVFRGEIPHVKHPKLDYAEFKQKQQIDSMEEFAKLRRFAVNRMAAMKEATQAAAPISTTGTGAAIRKYSQPVEEERVKRSRKVLGTESSPMASPQTDTTKRAKKRRSYEKFGNIEERTQRLQEIESNRQDRQTKRRLARAQQTQNFYTSLHMLQANNLLRESGEDSSSAFEDYSLYLYRQQAPLFGDRVKEMEQKLKYPDRDRGLAAPYPRSSAIAPDGEQMSDRIKSMEQRIGGKYAPSTEKKPKDLMRAIGKIDSNDWNVKEIEKKIELSRKATDIGKSRERVPKWNREQFLARQNKLTQKPDDEKYQEFDSTLKAVDKQLKEGHNLDLGERGKNKVASIAGQLLSSKHPQQQQVPQEQQQQPPKTTSKTALVLTASGVAEKCHFCKQRVYLMEKISAEGLTLHRSCLKCHHCHTNLRLGGYAFDRDDPEGKFYCTQHFKLPSKTIKTVPKKSLPRTPHTTDAKKPATAAAMAAAANKPTTPDSKSSSQFDLLDRGETPERIEFENIDEYISDGEAPMEVIDENEWTDRNFGSDSDASDDDDMSSSDESETDSESDYEEAAGSPLGAQTLQLASEWISDKRFSNMVDSDDDFYGYSSEDDEADSQTEGEELARAREIRMQEVKLKAPPTLPTDTETEGASDSDSMSDEVNSATEISTDSEFDHEPSHRLPPQILIDDTHLRRPARVQVKQMTIDNGVRPLHRRQFAESGSSKAASSNRTSNDPYSKRDIHLEFKPLVEVDPSIKLSQIRPAPLAIPRTGDYTLSKTASTEGIASKKSLELKKKYLLGESTMGGGVLKSGSASALDSKFKSFHSNITECQKLLHPAPEISPTMQTFLQKTAAPGTGTSPLAKKESIQAGKNDEKENVYDGKISGSVVGQKRYVETVNSTLIENKLNEMKKEEEAMKDDRPNNNEKIKESIDLITPEKDRKEDVELKKEEGGTGDKIVEIKNISNLKHMLIDLTADSPISDRTLAKNANLKHMVIDLTSDSPNCDRSLVETTLNFSMTPPSAKGTASAATHANGELKDNVPDIISNIKIDSNENKVEVPTLPDVEEDEERTRSPAHETSIQVPEVPWNKDEEEEELDSDSMTESTTSTTSSVEDIPHYILDSTTSPETQNDERFVPRVEIRDTAGELMQIDSLMIIDGKYIGDPEDLKLLEQLPPDTQIAAELSQQEMNLDSINTIVAAPSEIVADVEEFERERTPTPPKPVESPQEPSIPLPVLEIETNTIPPKPAVVQTAQKSSSPTQPKPDLKFDTRNENKLDTLKNLPLVLDQTETKQMPQKPRHLTFASRQKSPDTDAEKTPMAPSQHLPQLAKAEGSDSETELTTQNLTETELSDWAADDAVSENFVDIEFALNTNNKGTIRRNKPKHGRLQQKKGLSQVQVKSVEPPPVLPPKRQPSTEDGIIKNLAIEDIEFMDTGSEEESCIESYSTTNRTMLKSRGYVEFVDPTQSDNRTHYLVGKQNFSAQPSFKPKLVEAINKQVAGVDYIEQGSYLLNNCSQDDSKTPMNEDPPTKITFSALAAQNKSLLGLEQSQQPDSLNDMEEDSLLVLTSSQGAGETTTTEESEAPTIVAGTAACATAGSGSSGRGSVSSLGSKHVEGSPSRKISATNESSSNGKRSSLERKDVRKDSLKNNLEDLGYDEYVKRLQQKITQISNARDSLEVKKTKRKSSKDEIGPDAVFNGDKPYEELTPTGSDPARKIASIYTEQSSIEVPKSVEKKIEEITKERVKQKDIIHDLVMDKLQSKKQLNAEKRLNRSRNRNNALGQPPLPPSNHTQQQSFSNCPAESYSSYQPIAPERRNRLLSSSETRETPKVYNSRSAFATPAAPVMSFPNKENIVQTPRTGNSVRKPPEETLTMTEQLREEARARARLKSNQDLGLSPEDRIQLLRKKFHINLRELNDQADHHHQTHGQLPLNKSDDTKFKERSKLMTSKSVNDVSILKNLSNDPDFASTPVDPSSCGPLMVGSRLQDYVSDPNLVQSPVISPNGTSSGEMRLRTRSKCKDRERRKSIIEKVSEFFHPKKKDSSSSKDCSPTKDARKSAGSIGSGENLHLAVSGSSPNSCPAGSSSSTTGGPSSTVPTSYSSSSSSGGGGGFLRFKISPKLKDKSKSCFDMRSIGFGTKEGSPYERCASEDCLKNNTKLPNQAATTASSPKQAKPRSSSTSTSPVTSGPGTGGGGTSVSAVASTSSGSSSTNSAAAARAAAANGNRFTPIGRKEAEELEPPPIPPLPLNYQRSDDESCTANEPKNEQKKYRAMSKASRQAELKRLRIAQEIQREQEEIEVKIKELETRGVEIEKELRGESESLEQNIENLGVNDEGLVKEWLELMGSITRLKVRDEELTIRQQELQLEHRHAQLKEELNKRLSCSKLDKNSSDVAAEGAILNEMLEIVAKRQALRPSLDAAAAAAAAAAIGAAVPRSVGLATTRQDSDVSSLVVATQEGCEDFGFTDPTDDGGDDEDDANNDANNPEDDNLNDHPAESND